MISSLLQTLRKSEKKTFRRNKNKDKFLCTQSSIRKKMERGESEQDEAYLVEQILAFGTIGKLKFLRC